MTTNSFVDVNNTITIPTFHQIDRLLHNFEGNLYNLHYSGKNASNARLAKM